MINTIENGIPNTAPNSSSGNQLQMERRMGQREFRELMFHLEQVFWIRTLDDKIEYVSPAFEKIWGRSCASLYENNASLLDSFHPDDRERMKRLIENKLKNAGYQAKYRILRGDGQIRWIWGRSYPVRDEQGAIYRFAGISEDITEAEAATKEQSRLAAIIEYSDDIVVSITVEGVIIGWNKGAEQQYGYSAEEVLGRSLSILFPPGHYAEYQKIIQKIRNGESVSTYDAVRRKKDGTLAKFSMALAPIEARDGEIIGASKIGHDIAKIKQLEAQFIEAQKMDVIGKLAAGVAHDFNNILAVIMSYSEVMLLALDSEDGNRKFAEEIQHAAERASGLTRQLLVFSRKQTVKLVMLDLNEALTGMESMLRRLIGENITLTINLQKQIGLITADSGYVGQILMNLVVNARDAMPAGGNLTISTGEVSLGFGNKTPHADVPPGDYVVMNVSDNGTGMTEEVKSRVFDAFFTTKENGSGLGLSTCRTIVQQIAAYIGFESEIDKGSTFNVYFPRIAGVQQPAPPYLQTGILPRGTETLLVVEDEPAVRDVACKVLESLGYHVLTAVNGKDGLRVAHDHKGPAIRLVFSDVIMPLMGGKVMVDWLKSTYPDIKTLFTSGYTDDAIAHHGVLDPDVAFLPKPYTLASLAHKIRELLDK